MMVKSQIHPQFNSSLEYLLNSQSVVNLRTHHEVNVAVIIGEVLHQLLKAVLFFAHLRGEKTLIYTEYTLQLFPTWWRKGGMKAK